MSDFDRIILNFAEQTAEQIKEIRMNVHKDLVSTVIMDTPVDTGMARRNWQAAKDSIPTGIVPYAGNPESAGAQTVSEAQAQAFGEDGTFYFVNNVHYVPYLENGTSKMEAVGMAKKNVERIKNKLRQQHG